MKKLGKILLWTVGVVVVLLIIAVIGLKLFFPVEKVRAMAVEKGSAALGREVRVEGLDISLWGGLGVELQKVSVGNPAGFDEPNLMSAENVDLKLRLLPLIAGDIEVDRLVIDRPVIKLFKTAAGEVNYEFDMGDSTAVPAEVADLPPEGQATALAISFDELEIREGLLTYQDDSAGSRYALHGLDLSSSLQMPDENVYMSSGRIEIESVVLEDSSAFPPVAFELVYELTYDLAQDRMTIDRARIGLNDLRFTASGQIDGLPDVARAEISIAGEQNNISALVSLLPEAQKTKLAAYSLEGEVSLDLDLSYQAADTTIFDYTGTLSLVNLEVQSDQFPGALKFGRCLVDFEPDNLRMTIEDGSFDGRPLKGHLLVRDFENPQVSGELAGSLDLNIVEPFLPPEPDHQLSGRSNFELKISGPVKSVTELDFSGSLTVTEGSYNSTLLPEPLESFELDAYFDRNLVNVRRLDCRLPSGQLAFTGRLNNLVPYLLADSTAAVRILPSLEATVKGNLDLVIAQPYLPPKGNPELSGQASIDARFSGSMKDFSNFRMQGDMQVSDASYADSLLPEPIEQFEAALTLRPDTIEIKTLRARFTSSDLSLTGNLVKPFPYFLPILDMDRDTLTRPLLLFTLRSHRFDVDRLFPEAVPGGSIDGEQPSPGDSISAVILPDIEGHGRVEADTVIYSQVEFTEVTGKVRIIDRRIECYDATARVYSGSVAGKTTIDLSDFETPRYSGRFEASAIQANDFVSRFTKFGGHLYGEGNFEGVYDAVGWEPEAFMNSLTLDGDFRMRDGRLVTSGVVYDGLNKIASLAKEEFKKEQSLKNLTNKVHVKDGRVSTDDITGTLDQIGRFVVNGSYGFDNTLNYTGRVFLSQDNLRKMGLQIDSLAVPINITGTITAPSFKVDVAEAVKKAGETQLKDKAKDLLNGLFKK